MPLVGFKPTKARLVIEQGRESIIVMKVVVAPDESVELATGGRLETLSGVLRIRDRRSHPERDEGRAGGTMVLVDAPGEGRGQVPAKFQIDVSLATSKFDALLAVALAGRLPTKFFVKAGDRTSPLDSAGLGYESRPQGRVKVWYNNRRRTLKVTNFTMILPIVVPPSEDHDHAEGMGEHAHPLATNAQVSELADEMVLFQSETKHTLNAIAAIVAVICLLLLAISLVLMIR